MQVTSSSSHNYQVSGESEDESSALINEAKKKKVTQKSSKQKRHKIFKNNSLTNMIKGQQEIERVEREKDREFFLKLAKAIFSNNSGN